MFPDSLTLNTTDDYKMRKYYVLDKPFIIGESKCVPVEAPPLVLHMSQFCTLPRYHATFRSNVLVGMTSTMKVIAGKTVICLNGPRKPFLSGHELVCLDRLVSSFLEPKSIYAATKIQKAFRRYTTRKQVKAAITIQNWMRSMKDRLEFFRLKKTALLVQACVQRKYGWGRFKYCAKRSNRHCGKAKVL